MGLVILLIIAVVVYDLKEKGEISQGTWSTIGKTIAKILSQILRSLF